jgi:thiamine-monophosphate kinase
MGLAMTDRPTDPDLTVAEIGEFGLIDRLGRVLMGAGHDTLRPEATGEIGIGDDAALWQPTPGLREVLTTDALIEDVHFRHRTTSWRDLGWKALAQNVSDIAAMGATPTRAFVTLGLRPDTRIADVEELYRGMAGLALSVSELGRAFVIAGGDTVSSPFTMLSITVVGELAGEGLRRAAGRPGDLLAVTGSLGGSAAGLTLLEQGDAGLQHPDVASLVALHRRPQPRIVEGQTVAEAGVRCGMDLSDGLLGDAGKLAYASGLSATLEMERLPLPRALVRQFGDEQARMMALAGGEDFELLVAAPATVMERASIRLAEQSSDHDLIGRVVSLTVVGRLEKGPPGQVTVLDGHGQPITPPRSSWDHFRQAETQS